MTTHLECVEMAPHLAAGGPVVERHVVSCDPCRATAAALAAVRRATQLDRPDLWPRMRARLVEHDDAGRVELRFRLPGWYAAAAVAAIVTATLLAPEPGRLMAVMLGVL